MSSRGEATRLEILEHSADIASVEGLEGLTIGQLAGHLEMSKSGLIRHFGSKESLQLATIEFARDLFLREVIAPVPENPPGLARLERLLESWLSYIERGVFSGGCFFWAASAEFDGRPGHVRDQIALLTASWLRLLEEEAATAVKRGELRSDADVAQLAFEVHALVQEANWASQLLVDKNAFEKARKGIRRRLREAAS